MKQMSIFSTTAEPVSNKPKKAHSHWKLFIDGAARNNPGPAGAGIYIMKDDKQVKKTGFYLGSKTNNQAEYGALLIGVYYLKEYIEPHDHVDIVSDSQLLVRQFKGEYRVKHPELKPLHMLAKKMLEGVTHSISHVLREYNEIADEMANMGIDNKKKLPQEFLLLLKQHEISW